LAVGKNLGTKSVLHAKIYSAYQYRVYFFVWKFEKRVLFVFRVKKYRKDYQKSIIHYWGKGVDICYNIPVHVRVKKKSFYQIYVFKGDGISCLPV